MNGYIRRLTVLFMCVALVIGAPASAMAAAAVLPEPSVGEGEESVINADDEAEASTSVDILITGTLEIVAQTEDCLIDEGDNLDVQVQVSGVGPFKYTWQVSEDGGNTWKTPDGATNSPVYKLTDAVANPNGGEEQPYIYRVTVEDRLGQTATTDIRIGVRDGISYRRILDEKDKVAVSAWMLKTTKLAADPIGEGNAAYDEMYRHLAPGCLPINAVELSLYNKEVDEGFFEGEQKVEFIVGDEYEGQTLRVFQMLDGKVVEYSGVVQDGILAITVDRLTQFMVEAPSKDARIVEIITGEGGTATPNGQHTVRDGSDLKVVFLPDEGYVVDKVLLDGKAVSFSGNSYTIKNIKEDHTLEVTYKQAPHTGELHYINIAIGSGKGSPSPHGEFYARHGECVVISLNPANGYKVKNVVVHGKGGYEVVGDFLTFPAVTDCYSITVYYEKTDEEQVAVTRTITATAGAGGTVSPAGETSVGYGGEMYYYIIPDEGYVIDEVTVDGKTVKVTDNTYRFINVVDEHTIHATFKPGTAPDKKFVTISAESGSNGTISPAGSVQIPTGGKQTFYFVPDSGYVVKAVYVNGKLVANHGLSYTLKNVSADTTIRVEFAPVALIPTGDITPYVNTTLWWVLLGAAGGVAVLMIILIIIRKKKDDEDDGNGNNPGGYPLS